MGPLSDFMLLDLAKRTKPGTNLRENARRYLDPRAFRISKALPEGVLGETELLDPRMVALANGSFGSDINADRTLAHEGTHSKLLLDELRRKDKKAPSLPRELRERIYDLLSKPEFFKEYTGRENLTSSDVSPEYMNYVMDSDEVLARLQAMEAISPKGSTIEKSRFGKQIFGEDMQDLDAYLQEAIPEGYLRQDKPFREMSADDQGLRQRVRPRGILQLIQDQFK